LGSKKKYSGRFLIKTVDVLFCSRLNFVADLADVGFILRATFRAWRARVQGEKVLFPRLAGSATRREGAFSAPSGRGYKARRCFFRAWRARLQGEKVLFPRLAGSATIYFILGRK